MLRFALPAYRLPRDVLDREIEIIRRLGAQFVFNTHVGTDMPLAAPRRAVRCGVPFARNLEGNAGRALPGSELGGVFGALHFLEAEACGNQRASASASPSSAAATPRSTARAPRSARAPRRPSFIDASARTCLPSRRRSTPPRKKACVSCSSRSPYRIVGERGAVKGLEVHKTRLGAFDTSGRRRPVDTGEVQSRRLQQRHTGGRRERRHRFQPHFGSRDQGEWHARRRSLCAYDQSRRCICRRRFRQRRIQRGHAPWRPARKSPAVSTASSRARAASTSSFLFSSTTRHRRRSARAARHHAHFLPAGVRMKTFDEAVAPLRPNEALEESSRCLRCDIRETSAHAVPRVKSA